jgi:hypothetical protein
MTTIKVPSEENVYDWELKSGEPLRTQGTPFHLYYLDDCGNKEKADISTHSFELNVYYNDCLYLNTNGQSMIVEDYNKLYFNIPSLDLKKGLYTYVIKIVDGISVISGKIRIT